MTHPHGILALDPGSTETGYCYFDGTIGKFGKIPNGEIHKLDTSDVEFVAIEFMTGYGMTAGEEVFSTCRWEGVFEYVFSCHPHSRVVKRIRRRDVKGHICENVTAKDKDVREALIHRFGPPGTKKTPGATYGISGDAWAALAIGVYAWDRLR